ncbi:MAG: family 43 glycosylhydrolase [Clostridia bacterium]|nr:family 43 glycosylhydrolase [Clostridia bacterium]
MAGELTPFLKQYFDVKTRLSKFMLKDDFETKKTVSIIEVLLDRALNVYAGASTEGRFGTAPGHTLENYFGRAVSYLEELERGGFPLKGRWTEPGMAVVDHCFVEKDGKLHLFYNRDHIGYEWDLMPANTIGHAVTEDLKNWTVETPVISADKDLFEDYQVWSPGIAEKDGVYYMYYTGVNINACQAICLATSKDLYKWEKYEGGPVVRPGSWGHWREDSWSDCRDSMVFVDGDGTAYMYYCTSAEIDGRFGPAVGIASSKDMIHWEDRGAYRFEICDVSLESPFVMKKSGRYYMFYTNCSHGTAYAISDDPVKGWKSLGMLIPWTVKPLCPANVPSCAEVFRFKNQWYISSCLREPGCEQYLEIFEIEWTDDGEVIPGKRVE